MPLQIFDALAKAIHSIRKEISTSSGYVVQRPGGISFKWV